MCAFGFWHLRLFFETSSLSTFPEPYKYDIIEIIAMCEEFCGDSFMYTRLCFMFPCSTFESNSNLYANTNHGLYLGSSCFIFYIINLPDSVLLWWMYIMTSSKCVVYYGGGHSYFSSLYWFHFFLLALLPCCGFGIKVSDSSRVGVSSFFLIF